jgi:adenylate cyclase
MERKLSAIVSVDIVGYSRLTDLDERGTHARVKALLEALNELITKHGGKTIKTTGDGALVTFDSIVHAVECAIEAQAELAQRPDDAPDPLKLKMRIGVNLGDIIVDGGDVYGHGVNIAVRLQEVAQTGSVYVSRAVVDYVQGKIAARFDPVGKIALKNILEPVEAFKVVAGAAPERVLPPPPKRRPSIKQLSGAVGFLIALAVATAGYWYPGARNANPVASLAAVAPSVPREDSIAVMPFVDLGGQAESELIVDGVFDDLITDLSKLGELTVLAANAVSSYKGQTVAPLTVASELDVRYVLEGSIRRVDQDLRINVRLIDSREGRNVWAQSYSGPITDVFDFQDNMVQNVVSSLAIKVSENERSRILARETDSIPAYEAFRRGQAAFLLKTPEGLPVALAEFRKAIGLDPNYGQAYAGIGQVYWNAWVWGWESSVEETSETAPTLANEYLLKALERPSATAYQLASDMNLYARKFDDSLEFARLAVDFAPGDPSSHVVMAEALIYAGRPAEAVAWVEAANRLERDAAKEPPPYNVWVLGVAFFGQGQYSEAIALFENALKTNPDDFAPAAPLAAAHWHLAEAAGADSAAAAGHRAQAAAALKTYYEGWPDANIEEMIVYWPFRDKADEERLVRPLQALGMPSAPSG